MKSKIIALALFAFTAAAVVFLPSYQTIGAINLSPANPVSIDLPPVDPVTHERPRIEVVFVLDTTGSMGGLIHSAKEKIWSIATTLAAAQPAPEIRMGLVAYRDRGDAYVTQVVDLSDDLDSLYARLMDFQAGGGGDGPESVNQALYEAVHKISWSQDPDAYQVVFLVGDAPPHMDYSNDVQYPETIAAALKRGILVNAVQCGQNKRTTREWERIAQLGNGSYFQVEQAGSAVAIATPFDKKLAELSTKLDDTRIYYGTTEEKERQQRKVDATDKLHASSSVESLARRATFNASDSGRDNFLGKGELIDDVASGRIDLSSIDQDQLPGAHAGHGPGKAEGLIERETGVRSELQRQIKELAEKRSGYLRQKVEETGGAKDSLDHKIYNAVREQAGKKGLDYEADALDY